MSGIMLGLLLAALDQTVVTTAMPRIVADLGGLNYYSWVFTAYLLTSTAVVPIFGKLSDLYGRKPFFMGGIVLFLIASALAGSTIDAGPDRPARVAGGRRRHHDGQCLHDRRRPLSTGRARQVVGPDQRHVGTRLYPGANRRRLPDRQPLLALGIFRQSAAGRPRPDRDLLRPACASGRRAAARNRLSWAR